MRPAEPDQIIHHGIRQIAHVFIGHDRRGAMSLGKPRFVGPKNHRQMPELWHWKSQRLKNRNLPRRVRQMIVSSHDMRDTHQGIIHHDGKIIGRIAVGPENDQIIQDLVIEDDVPLMRSSTTVCPSCGALNRRAASPVGFVESQIPATAVILGRQTFRFRFFPPGFQFLRFADTPIGLPLSQRAASHGCDRGPSVPSVERGLHPNRDRPSACPR